MATTTEVISEACKTCYFAHRNQSGQIGYPCDKGKYIPENGCATRLSEVRGNPFSNSQQTKVK